MKIIADHHIPFLKGRLEPFSEVEYIDQDEFTPERVKDADALLIRTRTRCNRALLEDSSVKLVATATIGTDQIDIPWCESAGITVRNSPGCNAPGVAQYVWSALLRMGVEPGKSVIGVVGRGNVGSIVAGWGRLLGHDVLVNDPPLQERCPEEDIFTPLDTLLKEADVVTLHTPLVRSGSHPTYHLIGEREIAMMKPGVILVNAARGQVVEQEALRKALKEGRIRAVIDTWEFEPHTDPDILNLATYATPHIAGYSLEGKERATRMVIEALEDKFGFTVDKSGLAPNYVMPGNIDPEKITASFDPAEVTKDLRQNPDRLDLIRSSFKLRKEP